MRTADLDYDLPEDRIATHPVEPRDAARLLVYHRAEDRIDHHLVRDLPALLRPDDALVFNTSAVIPARFVARRATGRRIEGLVIEPIGSSDRRWRAMTRAAARLRPGEALELLAPGHEPTGDVITLLERDGPAWIVEFPAAAEDVLERTGRTPLPPYILRARSDREDGEAPADEAAADAADRRDYQTVYADLARQRSVAAPTAGLHFTPSLLERLAAGGLERIDLLLHVGPGTFRPVTADTLGEHEMHTERFEVPARSLEQLARRQPPPPSPRPAGRLVAVGTTAVRTLESLPDPLPDPAAHPAGFHGETALLIAPGHRFRHVDALLTNFHLPRSTLLALVAAMTGLEALQRVYRVAIDEGYRFYSYGDAMLVL